MSGCVSCRGTVTIGPDVNGRPIRRDRPDPLVDSRWPFAEQCRALKDSEAYRAGGNGMSA